MLKNLVFKKLIKPQIFTKYGLVYFFLSSDVVIIWESNWNKLAESRPEIKTYISQLRTFTHFKKTITQDQII